MAEHRSGHSGQPGLSGLSGLVGLAGLSGPVRLAPGGGAALWLWRHPRPVGAAGRCIGRTDLPVDPRRAKRLAHRIRRAQRQHGLPAVVWSSPLRRCADVGRWLARWGWTHHTDPALLELDFGRWDGQAWSQIAWSEVAAWEADFAQHAPGGGEALATLLQRCGQWLGAAGVPVVRAQAGTGIAADPRPPRLVVAHAGFINACVWWLDGAARAGLPLRSADWPAAPGYGAGRVWPGSGGQ